MVPGTWVSSAFEDRRAYPGLRAGVPDYRTEEREGHKPSRLALEELCLLQPFLLSPFLQTPPSGSPASAREGSCTQTHAPSLDPTPISPWSTLSNVPSELLGSLLPNPGPVYLQIPAQTSLPITWVTPISGHSAPLGCILTLLPMRTPGTREWVPLQPYLQVFALCNNRKSLRKVFMWYMGVWQAGDLPPKDTYSPKSKATCAPLTWL